MIVQSEETAHPQQGPASTRELASISMVTVALAGEVTGWVDIADAGAPTARVSVRLGQVLARIGTKATAERLAEFWAQAEVAGRQLPRQSVVVPEMRGPVPEPGVLVSFEGEMAATAALIPARSGLAQHLRIQTGPMVWQVFDQQAFTAVRALWARAASAFG